MIGLKEKLRQKIEEWRPRTKRLVQEFGDVVIDQVTVEKLIGGMRDLKESHL
jgi:citrate synthase